MEVELLDWWDEERGTLRPPECVPVRPRYPVTDWALLWKEIYHGAGEVAGVSFWNVYRGIVAVGLSIPACVLVAYIADVLIVPYHSFRIANVLQFSDELINPVVRWLGVALAVVWCLGTALWTAGSITREREQRTLAGLLVLPEGRTAILKAKWLGGILRYRWLGYCLSGLWTVGLLTGALHPAALALLVIATAIHLAFLASLGVWVSLASRNTLWAYMTMALMLMVVFAGALIVALYSEFLGGRTSNSNGWDDLLRMGLNPIASWAFLGLSWNEFPDGVWQSWAVRKALANVLLGLAVYVALAEVLWQAACMRIRRDQPPSG
jgi:ABC-type transport system involved in multi-copper enzyme maturation permease subunit